MSHFTLLKQNFFASSERFGENFLETKQKGTSRNPYKLEDNPIHSVNRKIVFSVNTPIDTGTVRIKQCKSAGRYC